MVSDHNSVYVGGLAYDVSEQLLRKEFEEYGEIVSVKIVLNHDGQPRGYAFVTFTSSEAANEAIDGGMAGKVVAGRTIKVNGVRNRGGNRDRDRDRDRRDRQGRDRDRFGRNRRYSPRRRRYSRGRDRSPDYRSRRSPRNDRSRSSRSPSSSTSLDSHDRNKTKHSKEIMADNSRLKEELAKAVESQKSRREQVTSLEVDLQRAYNLVEELKIKEKKLEASLVKSSASLSQQSEYLKRVQRAYNEVKECQEKSRLAEVEFQELVGTSLDVPDFTGPLANGDLNHGDDSRKKLLETQ